MEKYKYYETCVKVLNDLIKDLEEISVNKDYKITKDYSATFYYLFIRDNIYVNKDIFDILKNAYDISFIHAAIIIIWRPSTTYASPVFESDNNIRMKRSEVIKALERLSSAISEEIDRHNKEIQDTDKNSFIKDLLNACTLLQRNKDYYDKNENSRNDYLRDLMEFKGYLVKDQSRRGISQSGKEAGETDLIFCETRLCNETIVECMN